MVRIAISREAYDAIYATLLLGSVAVELEANERGERLIWLEDAVADRLRAMRGPGESYSDVILRLVELETKGRALNLLSAHGDAAVNFADKPAPRR